MKSMKSDSQSQILASIFYSEVIKWRQYAAKSWSIIFLVSLIYIDFTITNFKLKTILLDLFLNLFSFNLLFYISIISIIIWTILSFYDRLFKVTPNVYSNNIEKILEIFYSIGSLYLLFHLISSFLVTLLLIGLNNYSLDNQSILFIALFTSFTDSIQTFKFLFKQTFLLYWPIQQKSKSSRFKCQLERISIETLRETAVSLLFWIVIYSFMRFNLSISESEDSQFSIFSFKMLIISFKISFILNITSKISWNLYEIYMTEIYNFDIQPNDPSQLSLSTAISLNNHPYIQLLGLFSFSHLSLNNKSKRQTIFNLNYSTNTPLNWNEISEETINILNKFLDKFDFDDIVHGSGSGLVSSARQNDPPIRRYGGSPAPSPQPTALIQCLNPIIQNLKKTPFVSKLYNENLNYKNEMLFVDSLILCHTITSLRNIIIASYDEDEFGVVQTNLKSILNIFVKLQKILEKFSSSSSQVVKTQINLLGKDDLTHVDILTEKLICTLNESLSKISNTFGASLKSLDLSESVSKRLEKYRFTNQQFQLNNIN